MICEAVMATTLTPSVGTGIISSRPWLHAWAVLTVLCTLPLLVLGTEVTTRGVGMVDRRGFRVPWHLIALWLEGEPLTFGYIVEHSHRTFGFLVGICVIVLTVSLWFFEPRRWLRWAGLAALLGVCVQGLLGIFRIELNALMGNPTLSLVHGSFAQLVFALLVSIALWTSRAWQTVQGNENSAQGAVLGKWSSMTAALIYGQLVLGGLVRHKDIALGARAHLLMAFGVVAALVWLAKLVFTEANISPELDAQARDSSGKIPRLRVGLRDRSTRQCMSVVLVLLVVQLWLGVESWLSKFAVPGYPNRQVEPLAVHHELVRSLHYLAGALLFSTVVMLTLLAHRSAFAAWQTSVVPQSVESAA